MLTSHSERVAARWSWTASQETTGSEVTPSSVINISLSEFEDQAESCFLLLVDCEDRHRDGHRQECEPLCGHRTGEFRLSHLKDLSAGGAGSLILAGAMFYFTLSCQL